MHAKWYNWSEILFSYCLIVSAIDIIITPFQFCFNGVRSYLFQMDRFAWKFTSEFIYIMNCRTKLRLSHSSLSGIWYMRKNFIEISRRWDDIAINFNCKSQFIMSRCIHKSLYSNDDITMSWSISHWSRRLLTFKLQYSLLSMQRVELYENE